MLSGGFARRRFLRKSVSLIDFRILAASAKNTDNYQQTTRYGNKRLLTFPFNFWSSWYRWRKSSSMTSWSSRILVDNPKQIFENECLKELWMKSSSKTKCTLCWSDNRWWKGTTKAKAVDNPGTARQDLWQRFCGNVCATKYTSKVTTALSLLCFTTFRFSLASLAKRNFQETQWTARHAKHLNIQKWNAALQIVRSYELMV